MTTAGSTLPPVLVLGATGGQGGAVAAALIRAARPVRALVRDPAAPAARRLAAAGAELARGDFTSPEALTVAMQDTAAAFALTTPFESGPGARAACSPNRHPKAWATCSMTGRRPFRERSGGLEGQAHILGSSYCAAETWTARGLSMMLVRCLS
jgi:NAD(P)-dependent dehydrogenase (short-subunit alcohol dehydrogenase family)